MTVFSGGAMNLLRGFRQAWYEVRAEWDGWCQAWRDVRADSRCGETVTVPLEKYCMLLEAAEREKVCHVQLGEAQETIRVLRALNQNAFC
jgi:hypothetical protein